MLVTPETSQSDIAPYLFRAEGSSSAHHIIAVLMVLLLKGCTAFILNRLRLELLLLELLRFLERLREDLLIDLLMLLLDLRAVIVYSREGK